jgi:hypothetical protein
MPTIQYLSVQQVPALQEVLLRVFGGGGGLLNRGAGARDLVPLEALFGVVHLGGSEGLGLG